MPILKRTFPAPTPSPTPNVTEEDSGDIPTSDSVIVSESSESLSPISITEATPIPSSVVEALKDEDMDYDLHEGGEDDEKICILQKQSEDFAENVWKKLHNTTSNLSQEELQEIKKYSDEFNLNEFQEKCIAEFESAREELLTSQPKEVDSAEWQRVATDAVNDKLDTEAEQRMALHQLTQGIFSGSNQFNNQWNQYDDASHAARIDYINLLKTAQEDVRQTQLTAKLKEWNIVDKNKYDNDSPYWQEKPSRELLSPWLNNICDSEEDDYGLAIDDEIDILEEYDDSDDDEDGFDNVIGLKHFSFNILKNNKHDWFPNDGKRDRHG